MEGYSRQRKQFSKVSTKALGAEENLLFKVIVVSIGTCSICLGGAER